MDPNGPSSGATSSTRTARSTSPSGRRTSATGAGATASRSSTPRAAWRTPAARAGTSSSRRARTTSAPWTSARLTTRGKVSFQYGRLELRAKAPVADGTWGAGWLLGDAYRDELSWPYCGEVDIFEAVGREIDDETGDGINHGSCHTRAYYFKQGNHISNTIPVEGMGTEFHSTRWSGPPRP